MSSRASLVERWYPERRVGGFTHVDVTVAFYARINSVLEPSTVLLDVGCGRGAAAEDSVTWRRGLRIFKGRCARVIGVDPDPMAADNPIIDEFHRMVDGRIPLADQCIDVCVADFVLEHVVDVDGFFAECSRVIKPGGHLFIRTPNTWSYMVIASKLVPNRFHARVLRQVQGDRREEDVFRTVYRCNTRRKLARALERHRFESIVQTAESEPGYLSFSPFLYALGVFYQRHAPRFMRSMLLACAIRRP